jgi:hypothetical protein
MNMKPNGKSLLSRIADDTRRNLPPEAYAMISAEADREGDTTPSVPPTDPGVMAELHRRVEEIRRVHHQRLRTLHYYLADLEPRAFYTMMLLNVQMIGLEPEPQDPDVDKFDLWANELFFREEYEIARAAKTRTPAAQPPPQPTAEISTLN